MSGDAGPFPLQPVEHRLVLTELCGRYGPAGCICHLDRGHLDGAGGAELEHDCGHCTWPDCQSIPQLEADARLVARAQARGVPAADIAAAVRVGPADGPGRFAEVDLGEGLRLVSLVTHVSEDIDRPGPLRRMLDRLGER